MTVIRRHNPVLKQRLLHLLQAGDVEGVRQYLTTLSCTDFRTATWLLGDELCVQAELRTDAFWPLFVALTSFNAKAFLGTMLKAAVRLYNKEYVAFDAAALRPFAAKATSIDATKTLQAFLPTLRTADEVQSLLSLFPVMPQQQVVLLTQHLTPATCFVLFLALRQWEHDTALLRQTTFTLLRSPHKLAYNMASIIVHYFGLKDIPAAFSLTLQPYELSRLEVSEELFKKMLMRFTR